MELKSGGRILCVAGDPRQTFVAKSTKMVLLSVMGNRVCAVVLSDTTGDRNQSDSGQIAVCGDRDDVRAVMVMQRPTIRRISEMSCGGSTMQRKYRTARRQKKRWLVEMTILS